MYNCGTSVHIDKNTSMSSREGELNTSTKLLYPTTNDGAELRAFTLAPPHKHPHPHPQNNLCSPQMFEDTILYTGHNTWLLLCVRPSCCTVASADQASSRVMCTRCALLATSLSVVGLVSVKGVQGEM